MAQVTWAETALRNVREIVDYVAQVSPDRAERLETELMDAPDLLTTSPRLGRQVPEFGQEDLRELVTVRPYRIIYRIHEDTCTILAVVHSRRDLRKLRPEDLESN
jgi:toxin ParE1/3/4